MPCFQGGECGADGLAWQKFGPVNFNATIESGPGTVTADPVNSAWAIAGGDASTVLRLTPTAAFTLDLLVVIGTCDVRNIDVRAASGVSLFSGSPEGCGSGFTTAINSGVEYLLIDNAGSSVNYGYFNFTGSFSAAFWQNFHGQHELA